LAKGQSTETQFFWRSMARTPAGIFLSFFSLPFLLYKHHNFIVILVDDNKGEGL
jgi:hypothetical protein